MNRQAVSRTVLALLVVGLAFLAVDLATTLPPLTPSKITLFSAVALMPALAAVVPKIAVALYPLIVIWMIVFQVGMTTLLLTFVITVGVVAICKRTGWAVALALMILFSPPITEPYVDWGLTVSDFAVRLFLLILALGIGLYVRRQREAVAALQEREQTQRDEFMAGLHDTVVTSLTKLVTRAEVLALEAGTDARATRQARSIAEAGRASISDLRQLLHELAVPEQSQDAAPGATEVLRMGVDELRKDGFEVSLRCAVGLDLSSEKLKVLDDFIREGCVNITKYAPPDSVIEIEAEQKGGGNFHVLLRNQIFEDKANSVDSSNSSGYGLKRLSHRMASIGGELILQQTSHTWVIKAMFPREKST